MSEAFYALVEVLFSSSLQGFCLFVLQDLQSPYKQSDTGLYCFWQCNQSIFYLYIWLCSTLYWSILQQTLLVPLQRSSGTPKPGIPALT